MIGEATQRLATIDGELAKLQRLTTAARGGRQAEHEAELLPVGCFHVVYTLPARLRADHPKVAKGSESLTLAAPPGRPSTLTKALATA